jgi:hypothetical protein
VSPRAEVESGFAWPRYSRILVALDHTSVGGFALRHAVPYAVEQRSQVTLLSNLSGCPRPGSHRGRVARISLKRRPPRQPGAGRHVAPTARGTGGGPPASVSCSVTQRRDPLAVAPADTSWARCSTNGSSSGSSLSNSRNKIGPAIASSNSSGSTGAAASPRATARSMSSPASSSHVLQNRRLARATAESRSRSSWPGPGRYRRNASARRTRLPTRRAVERPSRWCRA